MAQLTLNFHYNETSYSVAWSSNPNHAALEAVIADVKAELEAKIQPVVDLTVDIDVGWTVVGPAGAAVNLGESSYSTAFFAYSDVQKALPKLPATIPPEANLNSARVQTTYACAQILGLLSPTFAAGQINAWVGFGNQDYDTDPKGNTAPGKYSFRGVVMHEVTEVLGRACAAGQGPYMGDLFSFSAPNVRSLTNTSGARYWSNDNGVTNLGNLHQGVDADDPGDLEQVGSVFDAQGDPGLAGVLRPQDWQILSSFLGPLRNTTMALYDALVAKWATLSGTTQQKLDAVNALTVAGPAVPMVIPTYAIYNLIVPTEFAALTAANQQLIRDILGMGTVDVSPGTSARARIVAVFPSGTATFTALSGLAAKYDTPQVSWCYANGYPSATPQGPGKLWAPDLLNAGGLS